MDSIAEKNWHRLLWPMLLLVPYALGHFFPVIFWSTHFTAFLSSWQTVLLTATLLILLALDELYPNLFDSTLTAVGKWMSNNWAGVLVALAFGLVCFQFPIAKDYYGDAKRFFRFANQPVHELPDLWQHFSRFSLQPGDGRSLAVGLVETLAYHTGWTFGKAFRVFDAVFASAFSFVWLLVLKQNIRSFLLRTMLFVGLLSAPFSLVFFGHLESYSLVFFLVLLYMFLLHEHMKTGKRLTLWFGLLDLIIVTRFHELSLLLWPSWAIVALRSYFPDHFISGLVSFKGLVTYILLPIFFLGAIVYFFVLGDHVDPMNLDGDFTDIDRLFLPLVPPNAPLDRYALLSWNHMSDYLMGIFLWAPSMLLIIGILLGRVIKRGIKLDSISSVIALNLILLAAFLFMVNPLLSFPMDWDLMTFPLLMLAMLVVSLLAQLAKEANDFSLPRGAVLALSLISLPALAVVTDTQRHSYRMEAVAKHVYDTYHQHAGSLFLYSFGMIENDLGLYLQRSDAAIERLRPKAQLGVDQVFADLLLDNGIYRFRRQGNFLLAEIRFEEALKYAQDGRQALSYLMEVQFVQRKYDQALSTSLNLLSKDFPDSQTAVRRTVHCAVAANRFDLAFQVANEYLQSTNRPEELLQEVVRRIDRNDNVSELVDLFANQ